MSRSLQFLSSTSYVQLTTLPENPDLGQTAFMGGILYIYAELNGVLTWFPLNQPQSFYIHSQGMPNTLWTVRHKLGSRDVIMAAYDGDNKLIDGSVQNIQDPSTGEWYATITFTEAVIGYAVVFGRENISAPSMDAKVLNVTDGIYVGGEAVALESDIGQLTLDLATKLDATATAVDSAKLGGLIAADYVTETELAAALDAMAAEFEAMGQTT